MRIFPNREQLMSMSIYRIKLLDISSKEEEDLVQSVLDSKNRSTPQLVVPVNHSFDKTDFKSIEEEREFQKVVDARMLQNQGIEAREEGEQEEEEETADEDEEESEDEEKAPAEDDANKKAPFCELCTSKGVRHKKECSLYISYVKA